LYPKPLKKGSVLIQPFKFKRDEDILTVLRAIRDLGSVADVSDGDYVRLIIDGELVMSDTPLERRTNAAFIDRAYGDVFIGGLGLGLLLENLTNKRGIRTITVVEKNQDLIDLVRPLFNSEFVEIVQGDVFTYEPSKTFECIYFDIWPDISTDNLEQMAQLHTRYGKYLKKKAPAFMDSWFRHELLAMKRNERREQW
jgi:hypothetical protein